MGSLEKNCVLPSETPKMYPPKQKFPMHPIINKTNKDARLLQKLQSSIQDFRFFSNYGVQIENECGFSCKLITVGMHRHLVQGSNPSVAPQGPIG